MVFVTGNRYMEGGAVRMGDQYREQSPCLHLGPIWVLVSGVRSIFELCLFFVVGGMGKSGNRRVWAAARGRGTRAAPACNGRAALVDVWFAM
jgi:hypothetical protein